MRLLSPNAKSNANNAKPNAKNATPKFVFGNSKNPPYTFVPPPISSTNPLFGVPFGQPRPKVPNTASKANGRGNASKVNGKPKANNANNAKTSASVEELARLFENSNIGNLFPNASKPPVNNRTNKWVRNHARTIHVPLSNANSEFRPQSASAAAQAGFSTNVIREVHDLDLEREEVRQEMMRDEAGNDTINRMRAQEHRILIDSYLDQVDRYIKDEDANGVTRTIRKYQDDRRALFKRHRVMDMEYNQRRKFEDLVMQGNTEGIRAFIKNDKRRSVINKISPDISRLIKEGKHDKALKVWETQMKSLENESNTKSFAKRAKDAIKNGKGFGSAFKVKFRMPSFEKPEGQWVKRRH